MKEDLVSVIITTRNRLEYLKEALKSVLNQTYQNIEIIIVNDASEDGTKEYLNTIENKNIKIINNHNPKGANYCRKAGLNLSKGHYIAFLDDDDIWKKDKIKKQLSIMKQYDDVGIVTCHYIGINEKGQKIISKKPKEINYIDNQKSINKLLFSNFIGGFSFPLIRANLIKDENLIDENIQSSQDIIFYFEILKKGCSIYKINEQLVLYRYHNNNQISNNFMKKYIGLNQLIQYIENNNKILNIKKVKKFKNKTYGIIKFYYKLSKNKKENFKIDEVNSNLLINYYCLKRYIKYLLKKLYLKLID